LDDEFASHLAFGLKSKPTLKTLILSYNHIMCDGAIQLAGMLANSGSK